MPIVPTDAEVYAQLKLICDSEKLKRTLKSDLVGYLVRLERKGQYSTNGHRITGRSVLSGFYESINAFEDEESADKNGRQLIRSLCSALNEYYRELPAEAPDKIIIQILRGKKYAYQPEYEDRVAVPAQGAEFRFLGNNEVGMRLLISLVPEASVIEDTAVRWHTEDKQSLYPSELMSVFSDALKTNVSLEFRSITGPIVDSEYAKTLGAAYGDRSHKLKSRKLHHTAPLMNFLILYTKKRQDAPARQIVFFGYGRQTGEDALDDTAVFYSENTELVREYKRLFKVLQGDEYSRPIGMDEPDFWISHEHKTEILASFPEWPTEIGRRISDCKRKIVICIAGWPGLGGYLPDVEKALIAGVSVTIALWDPASDFVALRTQEIGDQASLSKRKSLHFVEDAIRQNMISLKALQEVHKKLKIVQCNRWGSTTIFWIDDRIYFGFYWAQMDSLRGPHFLVLANSKLGKYLQSQFKAMTEES